jgi:hypothetical protein
MVAEARNIARCYLARIVTPHPPKGAAILTNASATTAPAIILSNSNSNGTWRKCCCRLARNPKVGHDKDIDPFSLPRKLPACMISCQIPNPIWEPIVRRRYGAVPRMCRTASARTGAFSLPSSEQELVRSRDQDRDAQTRKKIQRRN